MSINVYDAYAYAYEYICFIFLFYFILFFFFFFWIERERPPNQRPPPPRCHRVIWRMYKVKLKGYIGRLAWATPIPWLLKSPRVVLYICFMICICLRCIVVGNKDIHSYSYLHIYIIVAHFLEAPLYKKGVNVSWVTFLLLKLSLKKHKDTIFIKFLD